MKHLDYEYTCPKCHHTRISIYLPARCTIYMCRDCHHEFIFRVGPMECGTCRDRVTCLLIPLTDVVLPGESLGR